MTYRFLLATIIILCDTSTGATQPAPDRHSVHRYFAGTTAFILYNLVPDPHPPRYLQINVGYQITPTDAISVEAITWQYFGPQGRPYGPNFESADSNFPGRVRAYGVGLAYRKELWEGIYAAIHSTPFFQQYLDESGETIRNGFQLFNTARVGYHAELFRGRIFIEPSVAVTYWPVYTNLPEAFQVEENLWPNYFLAEPGLHVGVNF